MPETWFEVEMGSTVGWSIYQHFIQYELVKKNIIKLPNMTDSFLLNVVT
jgi:hypothetical protein